MPSFELNGSEYLLTNQKFKYPGIPSWNDVTINLVDTTTSFYSLMDYLEFFGWECLQDQGLGKTFNLQGELSEFGRVVRDEMILPGFARGSTGMSLLGQNNAGRGDPKLLKDEGKIIYETDRNGNIVRVKKYGDHVNEMLERGTTATDEKGNKAYEAEAEGILQIRTQGFNNMQTVEQQKAELAALKYAQRTGDWSILDYINDSKYGGNQQQAGFEFFIEQMHADGSVLRGWSLRNSFPIAVNWGDLSYESDELVSIELTISYDYAIMAFENEPQSES